jgi:hypothetical protein
MARDLTRFGVRHSSATTMEDALFSFAAWQPHHMSSWLVDFAQSR